MPFLTSRAKVILTAGVALGFSIYQLASIAVADYADQAANAPRPLPTYNSGNPEGYNTARSFRDHGPPWWAGLNSPIDPPLSDEEFRRTTDRAGRARAPTHAHPVFERPGGRPPGPVGGPDTRNPSA